MMGHKEGKSESQWCFNPQFGHEFAELSTSQKLSWEGNTKRYAKKFWEEFGKVMASNNVLTWAAFWAGKSQVLSPEEHIEKQET